MKHIDATRFVHSPYTIISIRWEVDGASGSTECEAWRGQYEIERLEAAGYRVISVEAA